MRETHENILRHEQKKSLLADIAAAKSEMDVAQRNFDCVCAPNEVDIYIYRLRAAEAHYGALLQKLKDLS